MYFVSGSKKEQHLNKIGVLFFEKSMGSRLGDIDESLILILPKKSPNFVIIGDRNDLSPVFVVSVFPINQIPDRGIIPALSVLRQRQSNDCGDWTACERYLIRSRQIKCKCYTCILL